MKIGNIIVATCVHALASYPESVASSNVRVGGRNLEDETAEDKKIGGLIGECNPPKGFLEEPFMKITPWTAEDEMMASELLDQIDTWVNNATSREGALLVGSVAAVCNENLVPPVWTANYKGELMPRCAFWKPYLTGEKTIRSFFEDWLYYTPIPGPTPPIDGGLQKYDGFSRERYIRYPSGPGYYIEYYDFIANTIPGRELNFGTQSFQEWITEFLNVHGQYLSSPQSVAPYKTDNPQNVTPSEIWIDYKSGGQHPYNIDEYIIPGPDGQFPDYTQVFLRNLKAGTRPLGQPDNDNAISAPCDAGIAMLSYGHVLGTKGPWTSKEEPADGVYSDAELEMIDSVYDIPGKLGDTFGIVESFPGYGHAFLGGPVIDLLLWFTDYHHFHSPVTGTVLYSNDFMGSHQYDFDNFDPNFPFGPKPVSGSNQVAWYTDMDKHRRWSVVIDAGPEIGLVGMAPVGFWGVGSMMLYLEVGQEINRGDYVGHFLYGGSSILMVLQPGKNFNWVNDEGMMINNIQFPHQVNVRAVIGEAIVQVEKTGSPVN
jgi:phosphatidylserine decarboxylase